MSRRNPIVGRRRPVKSGDRIIYVVPAGPPAEVLASYGSAQDAISAGLTLLAVALRPRGASPAPEAVARSGSTALSDKVKAIIVDDIFSSQG